MAVVTAAFAAPGVTLQSLEGKRVNPIEDGAARAVVFLFTRTDCPISNRYAPEVERLHEKFSPRGIVFWLVYVDPKESGDAVRKHVREYGYRFGALLDRKHDLVRLTNASVTPETAVYVQGRMVYRGRIDNRFVAFGKARPQPTEHDLERILDALVEGRAVIPGTTRSIGCFIEDLK